MISQPSTTTFYPTCHQCPLHYDLITPSVRTNSYKYSFFYSFFPRTIAKWPPLNRIMYYLICCNHWFLHLTLGWSPDISVSVCPVKIKWNENEKKTCDTLSVAWWEILYKSTSVIPHSQVKILNPKISKTPIESHFWDRSCFGTKIALLIFSTIQINVLPYIPFTKASLTSTAASFLIGNTITSPRVRVEWVQRVLSSLSLETYFSIIDFNITARTIIYMKQFSCSLHNVLCFNEWNW